MKQTRYFVCAALLFVGSVVGAESGSDILDATGVKGGLVVHLSCGDGKLTAELRRNERFFVHGLDRQSKNVQAARSYLRSKGIYGQVSCHATACFT